ncbi:MAG: PHP domain-containing protein [Methanoregula sp.]
MNVDFHVHTNRSVDGVHSPRAMVKCARAAGLDAIAITDHNRLFPWIEAQRLAKEFGVLVIPGIEGGDIAIQKHWLALGIMVPPAGWAIKSVLRRIRNQGGLCVAPHPHTRLGYGNYAALGFDAVESLNGAEPGSNRQVRNVTHIPEVAGSDAHAGPMLGTVWTEVDAEGTAEDVLEAVRHGRCTPAGTTIPGRDILNYYYLYAVHRVILSPLDAFASLRLVIRNMKKAHAIETSRSNRLPQEVPGDSHSFRCSPADPLDWH